MVCRVECATRETAAEHVKATIARLEAFGYTLHKIATHCERDWSTVRNWKRTGRIEHFDWIKVCELVATMEASSISPTPLRP